MNHKSTPRWTMEDFDLLQVVCMDISGIPRGKLIPKNIARDVAASNCMELFQYVTVVGHACDLPLGVPEIMHSDFGNGLLVPIMDTLVELPWVSHPGRRVGQVIGHMLQEDGTPEPTSLRFQVDRQLKKLEKMGYTMTSSFTCQFTAFKSGTECQQFLGPDDRHCTTPYSTTGVEDLMFDACDLLQRAGVDVDSWSRGKGRGAFEMSLAPSEGPRTADMACRLRQGLKSIMNAHGYHSTFMTRPPNADLASTFAFRFTVRNADGRSAFYDGAKKDNISDLARHWLTGMIIHGAGITALCRPTVNCYRRSPKDEGIQIPQRLDWAIDGASSFLSLNVTGNEVWIETRMPSSACNPYFVMLATLAAGIDGIEKKMICHRKMSKDATPVPESLGAALDALTSDTTLEDAMSPLLMKTFVSLKRDESAKFKEMDTAGDKDEKLRALENTLYLTRL